MDWLLDLRLRAAERLPEWFTVYVEAGSGDEITARDASAAWDELRLRPRVLTDVSTVSTATAVLGTPVATPILVAPTAIHRYAHPDGEAATAAGTRAAGSLFCLSTRSGVPIERVADAAGGPWWAQVYVLRDRDLSAGFVRRSVAAGATALVLTADTPVVGRKPRADPLEEGLALPPEYGNANVGWAPDRTGDGILGAADLTPDIIGWLRELSGLPVVVKGVLRGDDAVRCAEAGAAAIYVSNHGGRQLDGAISTARALPEVLAALAGSGVEVYVDGGIRRGSHALRALALGARAVFTGRPPLWGLAAAGAGGVRTVLDTLTAELAHAMVLAGAATIDAVTPDLCDLRK